MSVARIPLCWLTAFAMTATVLGNVDLEWRPAEQTALVGEVVNVGLYAVSDDPNAAQSMAAMDIIFTWDPNKLEFLGVDDTGGPGWMSSGFPIDSHGLNEANPPLDGDGMYTAFAPFGAPIDATPAGALVTTFQFAALGTTSATVVNIPASAGSPPGDTAVFSGDIPNLNIVGELGAAEVTIFCMACPGDLDNDGDIDLSDLAELLAHFGMTSGVIAEDGDIDCDGDVDLSDLAALLAVFNQTCD